MGRCMTDPRQARYARQRAKWRASHPIGPFVAPDSLAVMMLTPEPVIVDTAAVEEANRVAYVAAMRDRLIAEGLWG